MFTLLAFNEAASAPGAYVNLKGAADQTVHVVGDVIYVPERFTKLLWCNAIGYDVVKAKLESPSIRRIGVLIIEPKSNFDYAAFKQYPVVRDTRESPISLVAGEGLEGFVHVGSNTTEFVAIGVCLGDAIATPIRGEIWTVKATFASVTLESNKWINTEITFEETLPVGRYQVVGAGLWHDDAMLFRLVPVGGANRPGGIAHAGVGGIEPDFQRLGNMGVWCEFHSSTPPSVDLVGFEAGSSTGSIWLDLIKIS